MTVQTKSWEQVGKKFEAVGTQLRRRIDEANESAEADRAAFEKVMHTLLTSLDDSIEAASLIVRDPVLRKDLTDLAAAVRAAMQATIEEAREELLAATNKATKKATSLKPGKTRKAGRPKGTARKPAVTKPAATKPAAKVAVTKPAARKVAPHRGTAGKPAGSKRPAS